LFATGNTGGESAGRKESDMDKTNEQFVLGILDMGKDLTIATVRPDGYPQATTVSYANDGMTIYIGIGKNSQKAHNIRQNNKVSLTVNADYADWNHIKGLSIGGTAEILEAAGQISHASECILKRFPQALEWAGSAQADQIAFLKIQPEFISVLDYTKGFGHTELVKV
jgi:general stress protein 26